MKTCSSFPSLTLAQAFEQFLETSLFARRTRESYAEDLAPLFAEVGQQPVTALTADVLQTFLARQESLAAATYNRRLAALRSFTRWLREQGWVADTLLDGMKRKPEGKRTPRALDAHQVESVLRKIENPRDRALFWLIYDGCTGYLAHPFKKGGIGLLFVRFIVIFLEQMCQVASTAYQMKLNNRLNQQLNE